MIDEILTNRKYRYFLALLFLVITSIPYLIYSTNYSWENIFKVSAILLFIILFFVLIVELIIKFKRPKYYEYNEDTIFDVKWNWHWNLKKEILNLEPSCATCGNKVQYRFDNLSNKTEFICKSCNKQLANVNSPHRNFAVEFVKKTIIRKLKKEDPLF